MQILWHSNAPFTVTGYGTQTRIFTPRLNALPDVDVAVSAFFGLEGGRLNLEGIPILPNKGKNFGNEMIQGNARQTFKGDLRGGLVLTLMDVWVLDPSVWSTMNVANWVPVDHDPAPPRVLSYFRGSQGIPVAMSRFGQERLAEFDALYVPHGVETEKFYPRDRAESRKAVGLTPEANVPEDAFVVGVVATNMGSGAGGIPSRKSLPEILQAFAQFHARHENARLYLHTELSGGGFAGGGVDLPAMLESLGLGDGSVLFCDQYRYSYDPHPSDYMAKLYSSFDVLLNPSRGEGFGLPVLEAQACGTPAIVTDFSAMREVCGAGWHVEYESEWSGQGAWWAAPKVSDILDALEECHGLPAGPRKDLSERAVKHAANYDADLVVEEHWIPALEAINERIEARKPMEVGA